MTREESKQLLPVLQAFAEGKVIQYKDWDMMNNTFEWRDLKKGEEWDWRGKYRIKSDPKYRPFKDAKECWNEMQKHQPFGWMKDKGNEEYELLCLVDDGEKAYQKLFQQFTFANGEPFGIKEEK